MTALWAMVATDLRLTSRQGEQLLVSLGIPLLLLVFFSTVDVLPSGDEEPVDFLVPGILALAVMGNALVSLGIATGFDRSYGVLKRLGSTPLGRPRLVAAKIIHILLLEVVQVTAILATGLALGWNPSGEGAAIAVVGVVLGSAAFAGLALILAGTLPGLVNLAVTNATYIVLLLIGGLVFPLDDLPGPLAALARLTPAAALGEVLRDGFVAGEVAGSALVVLGVWALVLPVVASRVFRWE